MRLLLLISCVVLCCNALSSVNKIYSAWYCADDGCGWATEPTLSENAWLANRGDGQPTINLVIFSFLDPLQHVAANVVPAGMTQNAVNWFTSRGIRVMFSIGGEVYSSNWNAALATGAYQLGVNAANIANRFGVGMEIDYESSGSESSLTQFVQGYRSVIPYDSSSNPSSASLLTVDLAAGTGYLGDVSLWAANVVGVSVNWAYAMVSSSPWSSLSDADFYWNQHLTGQAWENLPPLAANLMVVSLYSSSGATNCASYTGTVLPDTIGWVNTNGVRGISFWAVGCPSPPSNCANSCPGIQQGSTVYLGSSSSSSSSTTGTVTVTSAPTTKPTTAPSSTTGTVTTKPTSAPTIAATTKPTSAPTTPPTTAPSTGSVASCASKNGLYCADSTHFEWCPQQIIQSCATGTVCQQSGDTIVCGYPSK